MKKEKIGGKEKLSYALVNMGNIPIMTLINTYLLIFYTNVCGLDPAACATLFLLARVMDGISDPIVGFFIDHMPNTRMGHFRPTLIIGTIVCSLNFLLLWFGPMMFTGGKLIIAYVSYLLIGITFDIMDISLNSVLPVMTADAGERNKLSALKGVAYLIGGSIVMIAAPLILGEASNREGYVTMIAVFTAVIFFFSIIGTLGIRERIQPKPEQKYTMSELFKIMSQKPVAILFLTTLISTIGSNIGSTVNTYYFTYILGDLKVSSVLALISIITILPAAVLAPKLIGKFGKKELLIFLSIFSVSLPLLRLIDVKSIPILMITSLIVGLCSGLVSPIGIGLQADNTDYVELHMNLRAEGAIASLSSFIQKCAMGVGGALPGYLLAWAGFDGKATVQTDSVNMVILACNIIIPIFFSVVAMLIFTKYPLNKKRLEEQAAQMKERHGEK